MHFESRRVCAFVAAGFATLMSTAVYANSLVVKTEQGEVRGKTINEGKVKAFLGIPYAAAPTSDLRWKSPQSPAKWKGKRDATKYGAHCAHAGPNNGYIFEDGGASEDCLFLNVYTRADAKKNSKLPVMFWIHGGGYTDGASSEPRHHGDFLPEKGVVLVTINYRLGVFGFLATTDLAKEADGAAGNYGLQDMIAALRWVKVNVARFGGDPDSVTVFGESAGSIAVSTLMASPLAQGLFQKAIGESGSALGEGERAYQALAAREATDSAWVSSLGVKTLRELRALPAETILKAAENEGAPRFRPDIDGKVLLEPITEIYAEGKQAHIPLLAGWSRDEYSALAENTTAVKWKDYATKSFNERAEEFLELYPGDTDEQAVASATEYGGDSFMAFVTWKWIEAHRKTGNSPVFRYRFDLRALPSTDNPGTLAFHSDDIEYVFGTLDTRPGETVRPEDRKLSDQMMSYWTNFAKTGDPNGAGLPEWPRYDRNDLMIHLDSTITYGPDTHRKRYEFFLKGIPAFHLQL